MSEQKYRSAADQLRQQITSVEEGILSLEKCNGELLSKQHEIEAAISSLTEVQDKQKSEHISKLEEIERKVTEADDLLKRLTTQKEELTKSVEELTAEKKELSLSLVDGQAKARIEQDMIANRIKELDEREKNLRIRENKVELGEAKLIRNSNLLNL